MPTHTVNPSCSRHQADACSPAPEIIKDPQLIAVERLAHRVLLNGMQGTLVLSLRKVRCCTLHIGLGACCMGINGALKAKHDVIDAVLDCRARFTPGIQEHQIDTTGRGCSLEEVLSPLTMRQVQLGNIQAIYLLNTDCPRQPHRELSKCVGRGIGRTPRSHRNESEQPFKLTC